MFIDGSDTAFAARQLSTRRQKPLCDWPHVAAPNPRDISLYIPGYLRTSHSHDDVDQVFGQIGRLLMGKTCQSANEMIALLEDCIQQGQPSEKSGRIRGSVATTNKLDQVSCWKKYVGQMGVTFKGLRHVHYMRFSCWLLSRNEGTMENDNDHELPFMDS